MLRFRIEFTHDYGDKHENKEFQNIYEALNYCWSIAPEYEFEEIIIKKPHKYNYDKKCDELQTDRDYDLEIYDTYRE